MAHTEEVSKIGSLVTSASAGMGGGQRRCRTYDVYRKQETGKYEYMSSVHKSMNAPPSDQPPQAR
jgi:hypothetical protein